MTFLCMVDQLFKTVKALTSLTDKGPIPSRPLGVKHVRYDLISWPTPTGSFTLIPPKYVWYFPISSVIHRQPEAHRHAQDPFQELETQGWPRGRRRKVVGDPVCQWNPRVFSLPCVLLLPHRKVHTNKIHPFKWNSAFLVNLQSCNLQQYLVLELYGQSCLSPFGLLG